MSSPRYCIHGIAFRITVWVDIQITAIVSAVSQMLFGFSMVYNSGADAGNSPNIYLTFENHKIYKILLTAAEHMTGGDSELVESRSHSRSTIMLLLCDIT